MRRTRPFFLSIESTNEPAEGSPSLRKGSVGPEVAEETSVFKLFELSLHSRLGRDVHNVVARLLKHDGQGVEVGPVDNVASESGCCTLCDQVVLLFAERDYFVARGQEGRDLSELQIFLEEFGVRPKRFSLESELGNLLDGVAQLRAVLADGRRGVGKVLARLVGAVLVGGRHSSLGPLEPVL